jgi:hypothetical protein
MNQKDDSEAELEPEPTAEERAEAEALARALEAGAPDALQPDDALATAALLRHARRAQDPGDGARAETRIAAAAARVLPAIDRRRPRRRRWLLPALLVPAGAAALLVVSATLTTRTRLQFISASVTLEAAVPRAIPPPVALLEAQARAARGGADLSALDRQMRDYRQAYYSAAGGGDTEER